METKKQKFVKEFDEKIIGIRYLVLAIQQVNGTIDIVSKAMDLEEEYHLIISAYDRDLRMYSDARIKILDWMIV